MRATGFIAAALAALAPASALAQTPAPAPAAQPLQITPATFNLASCAVARNAGDARWLAAIVSKRVTLAANVENGAKTNALQSVFYGCPGEGADVPTAIRIVAATLLVHPASVNFPRRTDPLADCVAKASPREAKAFVETVDVKKAANDPAPAKDYQALLGKTGKTCSAEATKLGDKVQENELYSRLNWLLRAAPALASAPSPTSRAAGQ